MIKAAEDPPGTDRTSDADDDPAGRMMAATGALIQAQMHTNEAALQQLFAEFRALATLIPGGAPSKDDDDDRFNDVPV